MNRCTVVETIPIPNRTWRSISVASTSILQVFLENESIRMTMQRIRKRNPSVNPMWFRRKYSKGGSVRARPMLWKPRMLRISILHMVSPNNWKIAPTFGITMWTLASQWIVRLVINFRIFYIRCERVLAAMTVRLRLTIELAIVITIIDQLKTPRHQT